MPEEAFNVHGFSEEFLKIKKHFVKLQMNSLISLKEKNNYS